MALRAVLDASRERPAAGETLHRMRCKRNNTYAGLIDSSEERAVRARGLFVGKWGKLGGWVKQMQRRKPMRGSLHCGAAGLWSRMTAPARAVRQDFGRDDGSCKRGAAGLWSR